MNIVQQKIKTFRITERLFDLVLLFLSARLAIIFEHLYHLQVWHTLDSESFNLNTLFIVFTVWILLIHIFEHDLTYRSTSLLIIIQNVTFISFIGVTTIIALDFMMQADLFKRSTITFFGIISFFFLLLKRGGMKYFLSAIRYEGMDSKNILIIGSHNRAIRLIHEFNAHKEYGLQIRSILDPEPNRVGQEVDGMTVSGDLTIFKREIKEKAIDEVFFALDLNTIKDVTKLFSYLDTIGVSYHMMINESVHSYSDQYLDVEPTTISYYGIPMLSFRSIPAGYVKLYLKHAIEKVFALILVIFTLPIMILFGILIKYTSKGPIIYKQERVGFHGRKFFQYKLRSMVYNADNLKDKYQYLNEQTGPIFKIKNDPRLTKVGKFMRKYSIDELPQLFNILMGSMNLIGPRPPVPSEVKQYKDIHLRRLSMKPGITGLWQVSGRNKVKDFDKWVKLDLEYIDNWCFTLDLKIALKTVGTVISGSGM